MSVTILDNKEKLKALLTVAPGDSTTQSQSLHPFLASYHYVLTHPSLHLSQGTAQEPPQRACVQSSSIAKPPSPQRPIKFFMFSFASLGNGTLYITIFLSPILISLSLTYVIRAPSVMTSAMVD